MIGLDIFLLKNKNFLKKLCTFMFFFCYNYKKYIKGCTLLMSFLGRVNFGYGNFVDTVSTFFTNIGEWICFLLWNIFSALCSFCDFCQQLLYCHPACHRWLKGFVSG